MSRTNHFEEDYDGYLRTNEDDPSEYQHSLAGQVGALALRVVSKVVGRAIRIAVDTLR